ncbi:MAG: hypothetical protein KJO98_01350 [Rhodothermia bacterium]|nr:hypothetical protein [Rhodothermia bacterium]
MPLIPHTSMAKDQIREIVSEVEQALGPGAKPEVVESVASLVLARIRGHDPTPGPGGLPASDQFGVVTATGTNVGTSLAVLSNVLADSGALVVDVGQTARDGLFALMIRVDLSGIRIALAELRRRLQAAAASGDVRVTLHREDLYSAMNLP